MDAGGLETELERFSGGVGQPEVEGGEEVEGYGGSTHIV